MSTPLITQNRTRITTTPNATMTTFASPILSGTAAISVWQTSMHAGAQGPLHSFDTDQVLVITSGTLSVSVEGTCIEMSEGCGLTIAPGHFRQISAVSDCTFMVTATSPTLVTVSGESAPRLTPAWIV